METIKTTKTEQMANKIKEDYSQLTSLSVNYDEEAIYLHGVRYRGEKGQPTMAQVRYLQSFKNVTTQSTSNLLKANKWFISACIDIAKNNPDFEFVVRM